ncbi:MAG TPA: hypothetical protein VMV79_06650 [Alphaproteobacteria bacterium]|nr:hypothetical protein [Alphaproteobacteria bacterium]
MLKPPKGFDVIPSNNGFSREPPSTQQIDQAFGGFAAGVDKDIKKAVTQAVNETFHPQSPDRGPLNPDQRPMTPDQSPVAAHRNNHRILHAPEHLSKDAVQRQEHKTLDGGGVEGMIRSGVKNKMSVGVPGGLFRKGPAP